MERRVERPWQVGQHIIPFLWHLFFTQEDFRFHFSSLMVITFTAVNIPVQDVRPDGPDGA
jgi:hypothetical protein